MKKAAEEEVGTATSTVLEPLSFPTLSGIESGLTSQASPQLGGGLYDGAYVTTHTHLDPETCVCLGKSTPPARQTNTTSYPGLAFVLENPHHQHVKPTPPATLRLAFVLKNLHHQHVKPAPPATLQLAFVLENPRASMSNQHHQQPIDLRLCWKIHTTSTSNNHHQQPFDSLTMSTQMSK